MGPLNCTSTPGMALLNERNKDNTPTEMKKKEEENDKKNNDTEQLRTIIKVTDQSTNPAQQKQSVHIGH